MVKHTQTICRLLPINCLSVFDHFTGLTPKGLKTQNHLRFKVYFSEKEAKFNLFISNFIFLYGGTLIYAYYDFIVIFFKIFSFIFWGKFGPKIWSSPKWLKFGAWVHWYMLITILKFIFSEFFSFIFLAANLVLKSEFFQSDWKFVQEYTAICLIRF